MMKNLQRRLFAVGLVAALGAGAIAQAQTAPAAPAGGPGHHMRGEHGRDPAKMAEFRAKMEERMAKRMGELKQKLAITPTQENAWNAWTNAMKPAAHTQRTDRAEIERLTTPERIDRMRAQRAERGAEMDKRMDATKSFYSALNAEQKKVFDAESLRFMRGGKGGRHGHGGHGDHGGQRG